MILWFSHTFRLCDYSVPQKSFTNGFSIHLWPLPESIIIIWRGCKIVIIYMSYLAFYYKSSSFFPPTPPPSLPLSLSLSLSPHIYGLWIFLLSVLIHHHHYLHCLNLSHICPGEPQACLLTCSHQSLSTSSFHHELTLYFPYPGSRISNFPKEP